MKVVVRSCFAMEIPESARHLSGNEGDIRGRGGRESVLANCCASSLIVDRLYNPARGQGTAITCFYFDFVGRKESVTGMLGSLVKQIAGGMGEIPEEI